MLRKIIAIAKSTVTRCLDATARLIKRLLKPATTTVVAGAVQDAVRSKSELVAENAMLRQQLIVAGRLVKRPSLRTGDRLFMVLLARLNRDWRDALHLIQPWPSSTEHPIVSANPVDNSPRTKPVVSYRNRLHR